MARVAKQVGVSGCHAAASRGAAPLPVRRPECAVGLDLPAPSAEDIARLATERLRTLYELVGVPCQALDADGSILDLNGAWLTLLGYSVSEVLGAPFEQLLRPEARARFRQCLEDASEHGDLVCSELDVRARGGSYVPVSLQGRAIRRSDGSLDHVQCALRDLSSERAVEREWQALRENAERVRRLETVSLLASGAAHDLSGALTQLMGYIELAADALPPAHSIASGHLRRMREAAVGAADVVRRLQTASVPLPACHRPMPLHQTLDALCDALRPALPPPVELHLSKVGTDMRVGVDPGLLRQALAALCLDAQDALGGGEGTISVECTRVDVRDAGPPGSETLQRGSYAYLTILASVRDDARPLPNAPGGAQPGCCGLGLQAARGIIGAVGGALHVFGTVGKGGGFAVYLPAANDDAPVAGQTPPPTPAAAVSVLVVDDDPALAELGRRMLTKLGYRAQSVTSGNDAWRMFTADPSAFDLLVTDHCMPDLTGEELAARLHDTRPELPIILMTGFGHDVAPQPEADGARLHVLPKPFTFDELAEKVRLLTEGCAGRAIGVAR